ncbi:MAG: ABC transporter ATP-binding protein, partial [Clostridiales bacterium]|nr:ABC transporter ATP-binding protein [Clostridiales bacterium]
MKRFARYALPYKRFFIFGPILIFCGAFGEVLLPRMAAELINSAVAGAQAQSLLSAGLPMFGVALFFAASTLAGNQLSTRASIHFSADVRKDAFAKIQSFSFPDLDRFQTGALVTRLTSDAAQLQQFTMQLLRMGIRCPTHLIGAVIMAFSMNIQLALVMLLLLPAMALSTFLIVRKALPRFKVMQERLDEINAKVSESISNVRLVKSLSREEHESSRFGDCAESLGSASLDANRVMLLQRLSMTFCMNAATIAVLWAGGAMGTMKAGDLAAFVGYVTQMLTSLMLFSNMLLTSSRAIVSAKRITEVLDSSGECDPENSSLSVSNGSVEFKDITFRHQKGSLKPALEDLSLVIEP